MMKLILWLNAFGTKDAGGWGKTDGAKRLAFPWEFDVGDLGGDIGGGREIRSPEAITVIPTRTKIGSIFKNFENNPREREWFEMNILLYL